jgi:hypothetical protein
MFLRTFAKLRKVTISFMTARLSFHMEQLCFHWNDFDGA